jgi:lysophospholipase L1-like esterase
MQRIQKLLKSDKPLTWVFYGDSITHGSLHTFGQRDYVELFSERVRSELNRPMDMVITTAISGDSTRSLLTSFEWRVARFKPDIVFLMVGMNDCSEVNEINVEEFEDNIVKIATQIGDLGGILILQTTCPVISELAPERAPYIDSYMDKIRKVASDHGLPFIDHTRYWKESSERTMFWMSNAFHPNAHGHRAFAEYIFRCLDIYDSGSHTCSLLIP